MNDDYNHEAYSRTARDAALVGVEDLLFEAFDNGDIDEDKLNESLLKASINPFTPFSELL